MIPFKVNKNEQYISIFVSYTHIFCNKLDFVIDVRYEMEI